MRISRVLTLTCAAAWLLAVSLAAASATPQEAKKDDHPTLPPGEGRELTIKVCSPCHQPEMVTDQALDEDGWKEVVDQMVANGATASGSELAQIVKYLARAFPAK